MIRKFYSQRVSGEAAKLSLEQLKRVFLAIYREYYNNKCFLKLGLNNCTDLGDSDLTNEMLRKIRKNLWPIDELDFYTKHDLFDIIEFLYDYIVEPILEDDTYYHQWNGCGYHYDKFSKTKGQKKFREEINGVLADFENGYELSEKGEILHKADGGLEKLLIAEIPNLGKGDIEGRIMEAQRLFYGGRSDLNDRRNAVKELVDCFEFLRNDLKLVLKRKDEDDLFNIANNFGIRHYNEQQKTDYDKNIWLSWMFHFYLATLHASLRLIQRERKIN